MQSPSSQRRSPPPGLGEAAARSQVGGGGGEEGRGAGSQGLCRNAPVPVPLRLSTPWPGNLGGLSSPQMGFYMCLQEMGGGVGASR